jgi:hypothetical protein
MDKRQSNKFNSYQSVKGVLDDNRDIYEPIAFIRRSIEEFLGILDELDEVATRTQMDTTGETAAKKLAKEKLARLASSLAASGSVYAFESSNIELEATLKYTYTDINYALDNYALQKAMAIETELLIHKDHLEDYMISAENLEDLHSHIEVYEDALETRGGVKSQSVADFQRLAVLFKKADNILAKKLDRFVLRLKSKYPTFYDAYRNARTIIDLK